MDQQSDTRYTISKLQNTLINSHSQKEMTLNQLSKLPYQNGQITASKEVGLLNNLSGNVNQNERANNIISIDELGLDHSSLDDLQNLIEYLKTRLKIEEDNNQDLRKVIDDQKSDLNQISKLQEVINSYEKELTNVTSEYDKIATANQILIKQMEELKKIEQETANQNTLYSKNQEKLQQENIHLKSTLEILKAQSSQMQRTLEERNSELSNQNQALMQENYSRTSNHNSNHNALNEDVINLKSELVYANEEIKLLKKKRAKDKKKKEKYKKDLVIEIAKREEQIECLRSEIQALEHQVRVLTTEIEGYNISESRSITQTHDDTSQRTAEHSIHEMNQQIQLSQAMVHDLQTKNAFLKKELQNNHQQVSSDREKQKDLELERSQQAFEQLKYKVDDLLNENQRLNSLLTRPAPQPQQYYQTSQNNVQNHRDEQSRAFSGSQNNFQQKDQTSQNYQDTVPKNQTHSGNQNLTQNVNNRFVSASQVTFSGPLQTENTNQSNKAARYDQVPYQPQNSHNFHN